MRVFLAKALPRAKTAVAIATVVVDAWDKVMSAITD